LTTLYLLATGAIFAYTLSEQWQQSSGYFAAMLSYMSSQANLFIVYNVILSVAIVAYRLYVGAFLERTLEGEVMVMVGVCRRSLTA
jgi:hypothetical protein